MIVGKNCGMHPSLTTCQIRECYKTNYMLSAWKISETGLCNWWSCIYNGQFSFKLQPDVSYINGINTRIAFLCNQKHEDYTCYLNVLIFWRHLQARCLGNRSSSFKMACPVVLSGRLLGWHVQWYFQAAFLQIIWRKPRKMLLAFKSRDVGMSFIQLHELYKPISKI